MGRTKIQRQLKDQHEKNIEICKPIISAPIKTTATEKNK